jgi:cell wall assembly regulator SMI1
MAIEPKPKQRVPVGLEEGKSRMDRRRFLSALGALAGTAAVGWGAFRASRETRVTGSSRSDAPSGDRAARVERAWDDVEAWLKTNRPDVFRTLNPGASVADLEKLEAARGYKLPEGVKAFWQRHDGATSRAGKGTIPGDDAFLPETGFQLFSLAEIAATWASQIEIYSRLGSAENPPGWTPSGVRNEWWAKGWMPFAYNGAGDYLLVDLDPAPGGQVGQVLHFWHDLDDMALQNRDFVSWFELVSDKIQGGKGAWGDDNDGGEEV